MNVLTKLKETTLSVLPIVLIVLAMNLSIAPIGWPAFLGFAAASILIIVGLSLFLVGIDIGVIPTGERIGNKLMGKRNLALLLIAALVIGTVATIAEPDVIVLADQVGSVDPTIPRWPLILMVSLGIGMMLLIGIARIVFNLPYRLIVLVSYAVVFGLTIFAQDRHLAIAFDSGGMATGPLVVPFLMALGIGVAATHSGSAAQEDSFGLIGLGTIGPAAAILVLSMLSDSQTPHAMEIIDAGSAIVLFAPSFGSLLMETVSQVFLALVPLALIFLLFHFILLHMSRTQLARLAKGLLYAFIGLVLFLTGVNGAFVPVGRSLGYLSALDNQPVVLLVVAAVLGSVVVLAEPSVWVLANQVAELSAGRIARKTLLTAMSIGVAAASALSMLRVIHGLDFRLFIIPGYLIAVILSFFSPKLFTSIAFDSGTVTSGPMSCTFILALFLGASEALGGNPATDAFGLVAMIVLVPILTVEILGIVYHAKELSYERKRRTKEADR